MKTSAIFLVVLVVLALAGLAAAQETPRGTPLSEADLRKIFSDGVLFDNEHGGLKGTVAMMASGLAYNLWLVTARGTGGQDRGTWRIDGDTVCFKWSFIRGGQESCFRFYKVGENAYESRFAKDGRLRLSFSLRQ